MDENECYQLIKKYYGKTRAKRSKVPYINHIDEGLAILDEIGASLRAKEAYCLHPIFQDDFSLQKNWHLIKNINPEVIALVMEYRHTANNYLSTRQIRDVSEIQLSPIKDVNDMLIADKAQNYKDFKRYHAGKHPRWKELDAYFLNWFIKLNVIRYYIS